VYIYISYTDIFVFMYTVYIHICRERKREREREREREKCYPQVDAGGVSFWNTIAVGPGTWLHAHGIPPAVDL